MGCLLETLALLFEDLYFYAMHWILPKWKLRPRPVFWLELLIDIYAIFLLLNVTVGGVCWLLGTSEAKRVVLISLALILLQIGIGCLVQTLNKK